MSTQRNGIVPIVVSTLIIVGTFAAGLIWVHNQCKEMQQLHVVNGHAHLDARLARIEKNLDELLLRK